MLRRRLSALKRAVTLDDTPHCTVSKRLEVIEMTMSIFGWCTQRVDWRPSLRLVATICLVGTSLFLDARKTLHMFEHRGEHNAQDLVEMMIFVVTQSVCSYRIYMLLRFGKENRRIIAKLTDEFCRWMTTESRRDVMRETSRRGWHLFFVYVTILSLTTVFFFTRALLGRTFPTPSAGFRIPYVDNETSPGYELLFFFQIWILSAQIGMALGLNNIFCALAVMVGAHLDCLGVDVDDLNDKDADVDAILDRIIQRYIQIDEVVGQMNRLYGVSLGLQPLYTGAVIVTSTLLYDGSQKSNVFLQISFDHIVELFIYCYIGDLVSQKSYNLSHRLYCSDWTRMTNSQKKTVLQMMHRCQKPFTLNAGIFGPLTMEMYSKSMRMTYSMWTVFKGRAAGK